eukprot:GILK01008065.1.p1 GENE.GILK01008065.1~~GILK01008065.1.p1  ORF type:complete len:1073 (-),score=187.29 GILK01008065.1:187-3405(-)
MDPPPKERGRWERGLRSTTCHRLVRKGSTEPSAMAAFLATRSPNKRRPQIHSTDACCDFHDNMAMGNGSPIVEREEDLDDDDDDSSSPSESEGLPHPLPVRSTPFSPSRLGAQLTSSVSSGISQLSSAGHSYASALARGITSSSTVITTTVRETSTTIGKRMVSPFRRSTSSPRVVASASPSHSPHTSTRWRRLPSDITSRGRSILHNGVAFISKGRIATAKRISAFRDRSAALIRQGLAVYHKQRECVVNQVAAGYRAVVLAAEVICDRTVIVLSTGLQRVRVAAAQRGSALASAVSRTRVATAEEIKRLRYDLSQSMKERSVQIQSLYILGKDTLGGMGISIRSHCTLARHALADATCKAIESLVNRFNSINCYIASVPAHVASALQRLNEPLGVWSVASIRMLIQFVDRFKEVGVATHGYVANAGHSVQLLGSNCSESIRQRVEHIIAKSATVAESVTQMCKNCCESIHNGVSSGFTDANARLGQLGDVISSCSQHVVSGSREGLQGSYQSAMAKAHELSSKGVAAGRSLSASFQRSVTASGVWLSMFQLWLWSICGSIQTMTKSSACRVSSVGMHVFSSIRVFVVTTIATTVGRLQVLRPIYKVVMLSVALCLAAFLLLHIANQHKQLDNTHIQPSNAEPTPRSELAILGDKEREIRELIRRRIDSKLVSRWSAPLAVLSKLSEPVSNLNRLLESSMNRFEETQGYLQLLPEQLEHLEGLQQIGSLVNSSQLSIRLARQQQLYLSHLNQLRLESDGFPDRTELGHKLNHVRKSFEQAVESIPESIQPGLPREFVLDVYKNKLSAHIASQITSELESLMAERVGPPSSNRMSVQVKHQTAALVDQLVESVDFSSQFQSLLASSLDLYAAGRVGRPDYALIHAGGSVVDSRSSPPYDHSPHPSYSTNVASFLQSFLHLAQLHAPDALYSIFKSTGAVLNHADNLVDQANSAGSCWAFRGASGFITIILTESIQIDGFTLEHISPDVAFDIRSAPKSFRVFGLGHEQEMYGELLGAFEYSLPGPTVQTFDVQPDKRPRSSYSIVRLEVDSNYGNPEVTCVYRFRVHGQPLH